MSGLIGNKRDILEQKGFVYHFKKMIYINRALKKVFSVEAIDDHDDKWLLENIEESNPTNEWQFYFNKEPSAEVKSDILQEIS